LHRKEIRILLKDKMYFPAFVRLTGGVAVIQSDRVFLPDV